MLLVNADDFGLDHETNLAIVEAFEKNYINNTTIMVNMPGFEEAVMLAEKYGFKDKVGLHFNIFDGEPLSDKMKNEPLFYNISRHSLSSELFYNRKYRMSRFYLPSHTRNAISHEALLQAQKYINAGFTEMHFDSHKHSHTNLSIYMSIVSVMREVGFISSRKSLNLWSNNNVSILKRTYKALFNLLLTKQFKSTNYFSDIDNFMFSKYKSANKNYEIMVHPIYENKKLINAGRKTGFYSIDTLLKHLK